MTAAQREQIKLALGRDVLRIAEEIQFCLNTYGKCDAAKWREFLQALFEGAGDEAMSSPAGLVLQLAILGKIRGEQMEQVCPIAAGVSRPMVDRSGECVYEGVRLIGPDSDKLIALTDALLFYCQVARLSRRPVTVSEAEGCVGITWSRYAPAVFRNSRMLELIAGGQQIDYVAVQESQAAA